MRKNLFKLLLMVALSSPAYPQLFSLGLKAGVPLNNSLQGSSTTDGIVSTETQRWLVGPTAELHLPFRISFEVDALYHRQNYSITAIRPNLNSTATYAINNWELPFLAKYELHGGLLRPFVDAGVSYRHRSNSLLDQANSAGFTLGGGVTVKVFSLRLSPELRYTRWSSGNVDPPYVTDSQNQADFLVGFTF